MGVGVDEGGHDDAALGIDDLGVRILGAQGAFLAHLYDPAALVGHSAVLIVPLSIGVTGDESAIGD